MNFEPDTAHIRIDRGTLQGAQSDRGASLDSEVIAQGSCELGIASALL